MYKREFRSVVQDLLKKYDRTPLLARWREAISFGAGMEETAYWIRDSGNVTNIVWLNPDGIRDITLVRYSVPAEELSDKGKGSEEDSQIDTENPDSTESMFNFIPLRNISSVEVREAPNVAFQMGLGVSGDKLVHVIPNSGGSSNTGDLYWVASSQSENQELEHFLNSVLSAYLHSR